MRMNRMTSGAKVRVEIFSVSYASEWIHFSAFSFFFISLRFCSRSPFLSRTRSTMLCSSPFYVLFSLSSSIIFFAWYGSVIRAYINLYIVRILCVYGAAATAAAPCSIRDILFLCNFFCLFIVLYFYCFSL